MYRILIVGGGSIGERHLRCFLKTKRVSVALCDNRPQRLAEVASRYPVTGTFESFEQVDLAGFDAAVVCVPAHLHVPYARRVLGAGVHVLIEKPLSLNFNGIDDLERTARNRRLTVGVAHVRRALAHSSATKAELARKQIGEVLNYVAFVGYDHRIARPDYKNTYAVRRETGGGAIFDIASHAINLCQWYLGPVKSVTASWDNLQIKESDAEDTVSLLLRFRNSKAMANLHCVLWQAHRWDQLTLDGTEGSIVCDGWAGRVGVFLRTTGEWKWQENLNDKPDTKGQVDGPFILQANNFLDAIEGKAPLFCPLLEAKHTVEVCVAAQQSGREGRTVLIPNCA